jgi:hypothetical protein
MVKEENSISVKKTPLKSRYVFHFKLKKKKKLKNSLFFFKKKKKIKIGEAYGPWG